MARVRGRGRGGRNAEEREREAREPRGEGREARGKGRNGRGGGGPKARRADKEQPELSLKRATSATAAHILKALTDPQVVAAIKANPEQHRRILYQISRVSEEYAGISSPATESQPSPGSPLTNDEAAVDSEPAADAVLAWEQEPEDHYDEIFDGEELRPAYKEVYPILHQIELTNPERIDRYEKTSLRDFQKDNKLYHIPRMLTLAEHNDLTRGVKQRGQAIQSFLQDYFAHNLQASCFREGVIPVDVFNDILERNHEHGLTKITSRLANRWGFWYGPDIIRGPNGAMYVCEDNIGFVGGLGDLDCARNSLTRAFPELGQAIRGDTPKNFYQSISNEYRSMIKANERIVLVHYPNSMTADNEEKRVIKLFKECGVDTVVLETNSKRNKNKGKNVKKNELIVNKDGRVELLVRRRAKAAKGRPHAQEERFPVGLVIIDAEAFDIDPSDSSVRRKIILDEAQYWLEDLEERLVELNKLPAGKKARRREKLQRERDELSHLLSQKKKPYRAIAEFLKVNRRRDLKETLEQGYRGILESYYAGNVQIINGPGYDFLGDKLFCMYVGKLIRHYVKEEPIIREIPTFGFANKQGQLDEDLVSTVFDDPQLQQHLVLKRVDGRGGDAVWVGPKIPREEFEAVRPMIESEPTAYIVQKYLALSVVDNQLVDLRILTNVTPNSIIVSDVLWGRGVPANNSNGKVNISDRGFEFAVCRSNQ